jgi:hypothetical protein
MPRNALIQFRRGTAAQWASANPVLASGEVGYVTDTNTLYVGNGVDTFNNLSQIGADISEEAIGEAIADYLAENPIEGAVINDDATSESSVWSSAKTAEEISSVSGTPGEPGADGADGADGESPELRVSDGYIEWKYPSDSTWTQLVSLEDITGPAGANGSNGADGSDGADGADGESPELRVDSGYIEWKYPSDEAWSQLVSLDDITGPQGPQGEKGEKGEDGTGVTILGSLESEGELPVSGEAGDAYLIGGDLYVWTGEDWENVGTIQGPQGPKGDKGDPGDPGAAGADGSDGEAPELRVDSGFIEWKYPSDVEWTQLVALSAITGPAGADGSDGADGESPELRADSGFVQWRIGDGEWANLIALSAITGPAGADGSNGSDGADGADGREVELQTSATHVQWRYVGETEWTDLVALSAITGPAGADGANGSNGADGADGEEVSLRVDSGFIQWRLGEGEWQNLVDLDDITGPAGADGANGSDGADGADGEGVPEGGTSGQWLRKESSTDFDTAWASLPAASTSAQGIVELATTAETVAGSDTARAVTPAGLAAKFIVDPVDESAYPDGTIFLYTGA